MKHNGRPHRTVFPQFWTAEELDNIFPHYFFLDIVMSKCSTPLVPLLTDALDALKQQLTFECKRVQEIRIEKKRYADAYNRFVALQKELQEREGKIDELAGLLGGNRYLEAAEEDHSDAIGNTLEVHTPISKLRDELPLWKAIRWYVGYAGEARINDILLFLVDGCRIENANRNGVESALRLHAETFNIRRKKREKFISLKGA